MKKPYDKSVQEHYKEQAKLHGLDPASTILDLNTRSIESSAIIQITGYLIPEFCTKFFIKAPSGYEALWMQC